MTLVSVLTTSDCSSSDTKALRQDKEQRKKKKEIDQKNFSDALNRDNEILRPDHQDTRCILK